MGFLNRSVTGIEAVLLLIGCNLLSAWIPETAASESPFYIEKEEISPFSTAFPPPGLESCNRTGGCPDASLPTGPTPNDPYYSCQLGLENIGQLDSSTAFLYGVCDVDVDASEAWKLNTDCSNVTVAVLDTGIDYEHEDLVDNIWTNPGEIPGDGLDNDGNSYAEDVHGYDFYSHDSDPMDGHGHGTRVAGVIGATGNNGKGVSGICWRATIAAIRLFGDRAESAQDADLGEAVAYARMMEFRISNMSFHAVDVELSPIPIFTEEVERYTTLDPYDPGERRTEAGIVVAAAGGDPNTLCLNRDFCPLYPAAWLFEPNNIVSVSAFSIYSGAKSVDAPYGLYSVDLFAPLPVWSTSLNNGYARNNRGTSFSAPMVSGAIALLLGSSPGLTNEQIHERLRTSVDPGSSFINSVYKGRLNVGALLQE